MACRTTEPAVIHGSSSMVHGTIECASGKLGGLICHGPWTLIEADVVKGQRLASYPTVRRDIENAGGTWVAEEVVCARTVGEFVEGRHPDQARSA